MASRKFLKSMAAELRTPYVSENKSSILNRPLFYVVTGIALAELEDWYKSTKPITDSAEKKDQLLRLLEDGNEMNGE